MNIAIYIISALAIALGGYSVLPQEQLQGSAVNLGASALYPFQGGTGTTSAPAAGNILIGNAGGVYELKTCEDLTGSADLCDGSDDGGGGESWATSSSRYWFENDAQLGQLSDVSTTSLVTNDVLYWTGSEWVVTATSSWDTDTTYTAGGTLLNLSGTTFSLNEGTLTDTKICTYEAGIGIVCDYTDVVGSGSSGLATSTPIVDTYVTYGTTPSTVGAESAFTYDDATDNLTVVNASTTNLSASSLWGTLTGDVTGNLTGTASLASALAANGANCSAGNAPLGVNASGAVESCFDVWTEAENTAAGYIDSSALAPYFTLSDWYATTSAPQLTTLANLSITESQISDLVHWSTTSSDYWETQQTARTADDLSDNSTSDLSEGSNLYYTDSRVGGYINASTSMCVFLTGSADLCDGNDAIGVGGGDPGWATSTNGSDILLYPIDTSNDVIFGGSSSSTASFWHDVSASTTRIGNGGAGDSLVEFMINSVAKWVFGADDSDSDKFVVSSGGTLGTNNVLEIDSGGSATSTGATHVFTDGTNGLRITPGATTTLTFF